MSLVRARLVVFNPQMASYVLVDAAQKYGALSAVMAVLRLQAPSQSGGAVGFCVAKHLTASSKVAFETGLQLSVAVVMVVLYWAQKLSQVALRTLRRWRIGRHGASVRSEEGAGDYHARTGSRPIMVAAPLLINGSRSGDPGNSYGTIASPGSPGSPPCPPPQVAFGHRASIVAAAVNFGLTAYSSLTVATMSMLHCVWVRDGCSPLD